MRDILNFNFLGNSVFDYLLMVCVLVLCLVFFHYVFKLIFQILTFFAKKTLSHFDDFILDLLKKISIPASYYFAVNIALTQINISSEIEAVERFSKIFLLTITFAFIVSKIINYLMIGFWLKDRKRDYKQVTESLSGFTLVITVIVWFFAFLFILDNLGFKISTVVASLGIGGVGLALASQAFLKDLFNYFIIVIDKPFEIGDFITVDEFLGTVEQIGIKSTRIRSLGGEELVFSNSNLTDSRVRNYKRMEKRRICFSINIVYDTPYKTLQKLPQIIETSVSRVDLAIFDRAHFASYESYSLRVEIVYFAQTADYSKYMDIQQEINLQIKKELEKNRIRFAFPTQNLFIEKEPE